MKNMLLATGEISDQATITGPIGAGDMALENLKKQSLQEFYRVIGNSAVIDVDLGSITDINCAAIVGHTGSSSSFVRVTAGDVPGGSTFDTGTQPFRSHQSEYAGDQSALNRLAFDKNLFFDHFEGQAFRYWRFEITDPSAAYLDMGRLYLSNAFQPDYNMVWGMQQGFTDASQEIETVSGESLSLKRKKRRFVELSLQDLNEDEVYSELFPLDKFAGTTGDVLFVPKPEDKTYLQFNAIYGKIEALQPNSWTSYNRFSRAYRIKELLP